MARRIDGIGLLARQKSADLEKAETGLSDFRSAAKAASTAVVGIMAAGMAIVISGTTFFVPALGAGLLAGGAAAFVSGVVISGIERHLDRNAKKLAGEAEELLLLMEAESEENPEGPVE